MKEKNILEHGQSKDFLVKAVTSQILEKITGGKLVHQNRKSKSWTMSLSGSRGT